MKKRVFEKLYQELFYIPKHAKLPDNVFRCRMILSVFAILACTAAMAASTFALFSSQVSTANSTIASAYYSVTVDKVENGTYICPLAFEDKHTFVLTANGTATTGYCMIQIGEKIYYTEQIEKDEPLTLTVYAAKGTPIIFTPKWGTSSNYISEGICDNEITHSTTPHTTYKVESTATLDNIAEHYGVTAEDILIYNGISEISVDMLLKIPGVDADTSPYVAPHSQATGYRKSR